VDLSDTEWRRIVLSGTVTNPTVGIKIATSGDAVAMDYAQVEDGAFATTPILTTTATVTRSADTAQLQSNVFNAFFNNNEGAFVVIAEIGQSNLARRAVNPPPRLFATEGLSGNSIEYFVSNVNATFGWYQSQGSVVGLTGKTSAITYREKYNLVSNNKIVGSDSNFGGYGRLQRSLYIGAAWTGSNADIRTGFPITRLIYIPKMLSRNAMSTITEGSAIT
jgi:hypothetical protein